MSQLFAQILYIYIYMYRSMYMMIIISYYIKGADYSMEQRTPFSSTSWRYSETKIKSQLKVWKETIHKFQFEKIWQKMVLYILTVLISYSQTMHCIKAFHKLVTYLQTIVYNKSYFKYNIWKINIINYL